MQTRLHPRGFTLIEILGVLIILGALTAIVTTNVMQQMKEANRTAERANLAGMAVALEQYVQHNQTVPSQATLASTIADEMALPLAKVTANKGSFNRLFWVDPNLRIGTNNTTQVLPFVQGINGALQPTSPRILILSSLALALPASPGTFSNVWNTADGAIPTGWSSAWTGTGQDLKIQRIDLGELFHRATFFNNDFMNVGPYSIENSTIVDLASGTTMERWYLHGTVVNLHYANDTLQTRLVLKEDNGFVFEVGRWADSMVYGPNTSSGAFGQLVDQFLAASAPPADPLRYGADKQSITEEFFNYLWMYGIWGWDGFKSGGSAVGRQVPEYRNLIDSQAHLANFTKNLLKR